MSSAFHQSPIWQATKLVPMPLFPKADIRSAPAYVRRGPIATWKDHLVAASLITPSGSLSAFCHEAIFGCSVQRLTVTANGFGFAGILLTFLHEAHFGCAVERFAIRTHCLAVTGLRRGAANGERGYQSCKNDTLHCFLRLIFRRQVHIPAAFLRLLHSLQYFGQVIPAGTFPAALSAFQSAPQAR